MITELPEADLIVIGARHPAHGLTLQAGYTLGLAAGDGQPLADTLPDGFLAEVTQLSADVTAAMKDKILAAADAAGSTVAKTEAVRGAKVWRRQTVRRAQRAVRRGAKLPQGLTEITAAKTAADVATQVGDMTVLFEANLEAMGKAGKGADKLLAEGKTIAATLGVTEVAKEAAHLAALPAAVRAFYLTKGTLCTALKIINDAGHELYAADVAEAGKYNLKILYRHVSHLAAPAPPPPPVAPPKEPPPA